MWAPEVGAREKELLGQVIDSGFLNEGKLAKAFEERIAAIVGSPHAVTTTSGTSALFLALVASGVGPGDEVVVPDLTFIATANAVRMAGATPVLADVSPRDFNLDPASFEAKVTPRTKAVIPVHVSGRAADLDAIGEIAARQGLRVIEDAAEALGSVHRGKALGSWADLGTFSFSPNKTVTTGQGGAVVTHDASLARRLRELKDQGRPVRGTGGADEHPSLGFNFKFTDLQAAVGLAQLETFPQRVQSLRNVYRHYARRLRGLEGIRLPGFDVERGATPQWVDALVEDRDGLDNWLRERGIEGRRFWFPVHTQPPYRHAAGPFPGSVEASRKGFWLPSALSLSPADVDEVCEAIVAWEEARAKGR